MPAPSPAPSHLKHSPAVPAVPRSATGKLVAFISAIPATLHVNATMLRVVEINFLCVHKKLRHKRLAPVMIREITRRVNLTGIWQAVYTAGVVLPKPAAECQYWHRSLNPKKLISIGFSRWGQGWGHGSRWGRVGPWQQVGAGGAMAAGGAGGAMAAGGGASFLSLGKFNVCYNTCEGLFFLWQRELGEEAL